MYASMCRFGFKIQTAVFLLTGINIWIKLILNEDSITILLYQAKALNHPLELEYFIECNYRTNFERRIFFDLPPKHMI